MRPASMLGVGPVQGIRIESSLLTNSQVGVIAGLPRGVDQQQLSQLHRQPSFEQQPVPNQPRMDDFLEQMFSLQSWSEIGGVSRAPWDFNVGSSGTTTSMETAGGLPGPQRLFTMSLMPSGLPNSSTGSQGLSSQTREARDDIGHPQGDEGVQYSFDDALTATRLQQQCIQDALGGSNGVSAGQPQNNVRGPTIPKGTQELSPNSLRRISEGMTTTGPVALQLNSGNALVANPSASQVLAAVTSRASGLTRSPSVGSSGSDGSGCQQQSPPDSQSPPRVAAAWCQSYMGGVLPLPPGVSQAKAEIFLPREGTSNDAHLLGKRPRDDEEARGGPQESLFNSLGGAQVGPSPTARTSGQQTHQQMQVGQGVSMPSYGTHTGLAQPQGAAAVVAGTARPRVRARRGQATDPHSIAERLRRERIAERMKALQELVPNSNKTDKASMLDEIIEYVKFLQLQVKVLSMSRLGGAGAVAPLVADLPAEGQNNFVAASLGRNAGSSGSPQDGMAAAERQVARLMEEDMGSAMQYLQTKGLCLMPVSLATAISSTNPRPAAGAKGGVQGLTTGDRPRLDTSSSTTVAGSSNPLASGVTVPSVSSGDGIGNNGVTKASNEGVQNPKDNMQASVVEKMNGVGSGLPSTATKSGGKSNEETSRRGQ